MEHDEAQTPSELGLRPIRLRTRTAKVEETLRLRRFGYGQLFVSAEQALHAIQHMERTIDRLLADDNYDVKALIKLRRLQLGFNHQLVESGKAYLESAKGLDLSAPDTIPHVMK